ncbi:MAG: putative proteinase [candidate division TM6 bacterium GW2011_GWF2_37_49]|nr:MAG: putative proteinase [candidate division TM6 bacterium GW2011_GWF2_37_49]
MMDKFSMLLLVLFLIVVGLMAWYFLYRKPSISSIKFKKLEFEVPVDQVKKVVLQNGMTILMFKATTVPKVLVQVAYDIGSYVETAGERGLAHLIEHMIFKGTDKLSEGDIDAISRKYGATFNAFTSNDITSYYFEANKSNWQPFIGILADCMQNARFDSEHLASELKAVVQELKMYKDNYWRKVFEKAFELSFPANHPYHYPVIGFQEDLLQLNSDNLKKFYKKYYRPDHATLFIVGDFDEDEAIKLVRENFEQIKPEGDVTIPEFPKLLPKFTSSSLNFYEDVKNNLLFFYWVIPGLKDKNEILSGALSHILGGGQASRFYHKLVDDKKAANSVSVSSMKLMEGGIFGIFIEPVEGKSDYCQNLIVKELGKVLRKGFSQDELDRMIKNNTRGFFSKLQNYGEFTYSWLKHYMATKDEKAVFNRLKELSHITSQDLLEFMKEYIDPLLMNRIEVLPLPESKKEKLLQVQKMSDEMDKKILDTHKRTAPVETAKFANQMGDIKPLEFVFPKPDKVVSLGNGLEVILKKSPSWGIVSLNLKFRNSEYLTSSKEGIAVGLMMDMLMEGSKDFTKIDNVEFFESNGVAYRFDADGVSLTLLNKGYESIFERLSYVLTNPIFPAEAFNKLKNIAIDSFKRSKDEPMEVLSRLVRCTVYKNHPFEWTFDDAIKMLTTASLTDIMKLHLSYMVASGMVLTIVGDFDLEKMEQNVKNIFGVWPKESMKDAKYPTKSEFIKHCQIDEFMVRDQVVLGFCQSNNLTVYDEDLVPLKMLNFITFYSLGSRLYHLREQTGLFYTAVGAFAAGAGRTHGFDYLGAILSLDKLEFAEKEMRGLIKELAEKGVTQKEIEDARQLYLKALIDSVSSSDSIAAMLAYTETMGLGFDYYDKVLTRVQSMNISELNGIAAKYFKMDDMTKIRIGRVGK